MKNERKEQVKEIHEEKKKNNYRCLMFETIHILISINSKKQLLVLLIRVSVLEIMIAAVVILIFAVILV